MEIRRLPYFDKYGIDNLDRPVSLRKNGEWIPLSEKSPSFSIRSNDGLTTTISRAKFFFCVDKQIDPRKFKSRGYCISSEGELITYSERSERNESKKRDQKNQDRALETVRKEMQWLNSAEQFYLGNPTPLLTLLVDVREFVVNYIRKYHARNQEQAKIIEDDAENQLLDAMYRGGVTNPYRWLIKRAVGISKDRKSQLVCIDDYMKIRKVI